MKKIVQYIFLLSINALLSQAPSWKWSVSSYGISDEYITDMTIDRQENIIVTGNYLDDDLYLCNNLLTLNDPSSDGNFISKFSKFGECKWSKKFGGPYYIGYYNYLSSDLDNDIYVSSSFGGTLYLDTFKLTSSDSSIHIYSGLIAKLNPQGNVQWSKIIKGDKEDILILNMKVDINKNIYIYGKTSSSLVNINNTDYKVDIDNDFPTVFLLKLDSIGEVSWLRTFPCKGWVVPVELVIDHENNLVISGFYNNTFLGNCYLKFDSFVYYNDSKDYTSDIFLAKLNPFGKVLWAKTFGGGKDEYGGSLAIDSHNNIYLTGTFESDTLVLGKSSLIRSKGHGNGDNFLCKFDSQGLSTWAISNYFGIVTIAWYHLAIDQKDNIYLHFNTGDSTIMVGNEIFQTNGYQDNLLVAIDKDKNLLWAKSYGSKGFDEADRLGIDGQGNLFVTGGYGKSALILGKDTLINEWTNQDQSTRLNIFIAKLDFDTTTSTTNVNYNYLIQLYPNPVKDVLLINLESLTNKIKEITVFDISGKEHILTQMNIGLSKIEVAVQDLSSGIYILQIKTNKNVICGKFAVQH